MVATLVFLFLLFCVLGNLVLRMRTELSALQLKVSALGETPRHAVTEQITAKVTEQEPLVEVKESPRQIARIAAKQLRSDTIISRSQPFTPLDQSMRDGTPAEIEHPVQEQDDANSPFSGTSFESLVGGKLPIWVGGIALIFAGFFLVRYTIESGLLGPGARSILATIFAFLMIGIGEFGGRLPKIGPSFSRDPRIAQSLAGAGVATLFGTLFMASQVYGLIGVAASFILVVLVTLIAFALSLRFGPPTALMGLAGGFAAPWVAGMGAQNMPALLLYLAVFIASLFGLAIWRRWLWLLVLASGGGTIWSLWLMVQSDVTTPLLGLFILISGAGAAVAFTRFDAVADRSDISDVHLENGAQPFTALWPDVARYAPMAAALVQLALLLPQLSFSITGWVFYFALSALSVALAWRDKTMLPIVAGALLLCSVPLGLAWENAAVTSTANIIVTLILVTLFGLAGHAGSRRKDNYSDYWAYIGLAAPIIGWFVPAIYANAPVNDLYWTGAAAIAALPSAYLAWWSYLESKIDPVDAAYPRIQLAASAATALMAGTALNGMFDDKAMASGYAVLMLCITAWAKVTSLKPIRQLAIIPAIFAVFCLAANSTGIFNAVGASLTGKTVFFALLPTLQEAALFTFLPSLLLLCVVLARYFALESQTRIGICTAAGAGVAACIWLVAKQPFAISTSTAFINIGFAERMIFTHILFGAGWLILMQLKAKPKLRWLRRAGSAIGLGLVSLAIFRFIYFDLLILNPVFVAQHLGPMPIANLGTVHACLVAAWMYAFSKLVEPNSYIPKIASLIWYGSLAAVIIAVLVTVRQFVHGSLIAGGGVTVGENYFYSAGLLLVAFAWLVRGISGDQKILRVAGLSLLTAVTLKVFLVDAATLTGLLRILSFLGLGVTLIGIGWAYGKVIAPSPKQADDIPEI